MNTIGMILGILYLILCVPAGLFLIYLFIKWIKEICQQ